MRWMIAVFLGACSYGIVSTIAKFAYAAGFTAPELVGAQLLVAATLLWLITFAVKGQRPTKKEALLLLTSGIATGLTGLFYYQSLQYLDASIAIVMLFQFTWIGILIEAIIQRRVPSWDRLVAVALLGLGTVLAAGLADGSPKHLSTLGIILGLLSGLTYALMIITTGRVAPKVSSWTRSALIVTGATITAWIFFPPTFLLNGQLFHGLWKYGLLNGLFASFIPIALFSLGIPKIGPELATILGAAELPAAVFMSWLVLKEAVSPMQWAGVLVILAAIIFPELMQQRTKRQEQKAKAA